MTISDDRFLEVENMLWEWELSDEGVREFAKRLCAYITEPTDNYPNGKQNIIKKSELLKFYTKTDMIEYDNQ